MQGWSHRKKQALIAGNFDQLIAFSRNYTEYGNPLLEIPNKPLTELVEGCGVQEKHNQVKMLPEPIEDNTGVSLDPAAASTGSASACVVE